MSNTKTYTFAGLAAVGMILLWAILTVASIAIPIVVIVEVLRLMGVL